MNIKRGAIYLVECTANDMLVARKGDIFYAQYNNLVNMVSMYMSASKNEVDFNTWVFNVVDSRFSKRFRIIKEV